MKVRSLFGLLGLAGIIVCFVIINNNPPSHETKYIQSAVTALNLVGTIIMLVWLIMSIISKAYMIMFIKDRFFAGLALVLFIVVAGLVVINGIADYSNDHEIYRNTFPQTAALWLLILSTVTFDAIYYLYRPWRH